jgi:hypothetical protein
VRWLIRTFDALVRRLQGVFEFSRDPECLLRLRWTTLRRPVRLADETFPAGTPSLELHLWNEHVPAIPPSGPDVAWATQAAHRLRQSMRGVAAYIMDDGMTSRAQLICGATILADGPGAELLLRRLGFDCRPHARVHGSPIERWQDRYALELMAAFNPVSLRGRTPASIRRTDLWMTMGSFLQRYATIPLPSPVLR